jgi:acyl-CoA dehydrogenase
MSAGANDADVGTEEIVAGVEAFIDAEVISRHQRHAALFDDPRQLFGPDGRYVPAVRDMIREVRMASADAGYYTMFVPEVLGGAGLGPSVMFEVWEAVFRRCAAHYSLGWHTIGHWAKGPSAVLTQTTEELRADALPKLLSGEASMCFAISEPDAGADLWAMRSVAESIDGGWRINGTKQWITNAPYADYILVFAATTPASSTASGRPELTAFLLPATTPGITVNANIRMFGHVGGEEGVITFDDVEATEHHVVGKVGRGQEIAMLGIGIGKLYNAAKSVGMARWAMGLAAQQVRDRKTFGKPLSDRQGVMFPLAESATELHAARLVALDCARRLETPGFAGPEVAMMKAFTSEAALRALDRVIQTHGASGFTNELHLTEAWMSVRKICVADGTAELMRQQIARAITNGTITF